MRLVRLALWVLASSTVPALALSCSSDTEPTPPSDGGSGGRSGSPTAGAPAAGTAAGTGVSGSPTAGSSAGAPPLSTGGGGAGAGMASGGTLTAAAGAIGAAGTAGGGVAGTSSGGGVGGATPRAGAAGNGGGPGASGNAGIGGKAGGSAGAPGGSGPTTSKTGTDVVGWAAVSGDGVSKTTGGMGGDTVTATSASQLQGYATQAGPLIIQVSGSFAIGTLNVGSNKTIVGMGPNTTLSGSVRIRPLSSGDPEVSNVIIKNIKVNAATASPDDGGDGIHIERAHHVWVDHCEVFDAPDGNTDITHGSNWITLSWNKYHYTANAPAKDHQFSNLIGHSENAAATDMGRLKVTLHHNWWADGVEQRMPRTRFGQIHVFNNYYTSSNSFQTVAVGTQSSVVVENNFFQGVKDPHFFHEGVTTAQIVAQGNEYVMTTGLMQMGQGAAFVPPYPYVMDTAADVPAIVQNGAGPR